MKVDLGSGPVEARISKGTREGNRRVDFARGGWLLVDVKLLEPTARSTDPSTAHQAAKRAAPRAHTDELLVLKIHAEHPDGLTDHEMAALAKRLYTSLGVRRKALVNKGLIVDSGMKRPTPTGSDAIVWRITDAGQALMRGVA